MASTTAAAEALALWQQGELKKVFAMREHHMQQICKLESELESRPLEYAFSPALSLAMKREESLMQNALQAMTFAEDLGAYSTRVTRLFEEEMQTHFARQSKARARALVSLFEDQEAEREQLWRSLRSNAASLLTRLQAGSNLGVLQGASRDHNMVLHAGGTLSSVTQSIDALPAAFARRFCEFMKQATVTMSLQDKAAMTALEDLHRAEVDLNHEAHEQQVISAAFGTQRARLEAEWETQEASMTSTYMKQREELGRTQRKFSGIASIGSRSASHGGRSRTARNGRWQENEKQSQLIHTAPVLAPSGVTLDRLTSQKVSKSKLENLDEGYQLAIHILQVQKRQALLWVERQELRMQVQLKGVAEQFDLKGRARRQAGLEHFLLQFLVCAVVSSIERSQ